MHERPYLSIRENLTSDFSTCHSTGKYIEQCGLSYE